MNEEPEYTAGRPPALLAFERWMLSKGIAWTAQVQIRDCAFAEDDSSNPELSSCNPTYHFAVFAKEDIALNDSLVAIPKVMIGYYSVILSIQYHATWWADLFFKLKINRGCFQAVMYRKKMCEVVHVRF